MHKTIAHFEVKYHQSLDHHGQALKVFPKSLTPNKLQQAYRALKLTRTFDEKAILLQRTGQLGTYPSSLGQEAISVAIGLTMEKNDVLCPYYRDHGAFILRGTPLAQLFQGWGGDERANDYPVAREDFPPAIPIATQCPHAAGVAFAMQYRQQKRACVTTLGDGATSKGDFYEALNVAGVWQLPLVFVINNNQWAISVPIKKQTAATTLAQKAIAAGIEQMQVDGNDLPAMVDALEQALDHARSGRGPFFIEALSYRMGAHTTADDPGHYRDQSMLHDFEPFDPISRLERYCVEHHILTDDDIAHIDQEVHQQVEQAAHDYLNIEPPNPADMFAHLHYQQPDNKKITGVNHETFNPQRGQ